MVKDSVLCAVRTEYLCTSSKRRPLNVAFLLQSVTQHVQRCW